jgi:hypothetical protein
MVLSFDWIVKELCASFQALPDHRQGENTRYAIQDAAVGAFSVFFMQSPSFLAHQRDLQRKQGRNNAASLFGVKQIPSDPQIRNLLDPLNPDPLRAPYWAIWAALQGEGHLRQYVGYGDTLLIALDGTYYFSSQKIHCDHCTVHRHGEQTRYSHAAVTPVLVAPGQSAVLTLEPEFILAQDGSEKQDCEQQAVKRWLTRNAVRFTPWSVTILTDDLHSRHPFCSLLLHHQCNFILTCKPDSHPTLYGEIELLDKINGVAQHQVRQWNGRFTEVWFCRYVNQLPLRSGEDALLVNWCEVRIVREQTGELLYHNAFITNHTLTDQTVQPILRSGRSRWKIENENNNVLKNYGYHLEHNFGHGQHYLSAVLVMLNLLAFLVHTVLSLTSVNYQLLRQELGARRTFFDDLRTLTRYFFFQSWDHLLDFMVTQLELQPIPDTS